MSKPNNFIDGTEVICHPEYDKTLSALSGEPIFIPKSRSHEILDSIEKAAKGQNHRFVASGCEAMFMDID